MENGFASPVYVAEVSAKPVPASFHFPVSEYFPVPLAGIAMIVFELECIYEEIRGICLKEEV